MGDKEYSTRAFEEALTAYGLTAEDLKERMDGEIRVDYLLDDDFSWEELFSKRAATDPEEELAERTLQIEHHAEQAGKLLAREACRDAETMIRDYRRDPAYGEEFAYRLIAEYTLPLLREARSELVGECSRMKLRNGERYEDLGLSASETKQASRLGGDREARTLAYLKLADEYLEYTAWEKQREHLIRVMSTVISFCENMLPSGGGQPQAPQSAARKEAGKRLAVPRRCTITTDDGISYAVEISDGEERIFESSLSLEAAAETARRWM